LAVEGLLESGSPRADVLQMCLPFVETQRHLHSRKIQLLKVLFLDHSSSAPVPGHVDAADMNVFPSDPGIFNFSVSVVKL
jgi:hypothetical protein